MASKGAVSVPHSTKRRAYASVHAVVRETSEDIAIAAPEHRPAAEAGKAGTLARGLAIVQILLKSPQPLGLADISAQANLDQSTTFRILHTLESEGYILKPRGERRYLASPKSMKPLAPAHPLEQFRHDAGPVIAELAADFRMTVLLVVYVAGQRLVVDIAQHSGSLMPYYESWLTGPLHGSAPGKALLLASPAEARRDLLGPEPYRAWTSRTKTTWAELEPDIAEASRLGYVWQQDEFYEGITAMGANFSNWAERPIGCIAVTGRTRELSATRIHEVGTSLANAALLLRMQATSLNALEQFCGV